ncbi:IS110 family transposase [Ornithinimicrobium sufpigmenti]|uniref:IS110 family transposase n=1 Tax=Ornithinimicrobium sufpigmenti TaxID=2508882 RepID=UPI0010366E39|nr:MULTISPECIES: transposase [unclassified Ornithinimicrobium]
MLLQTPLGSSALVVAIDPGKVMNRVWVSDYGGLVSDPVSMPVSRAGIEGLERAVSSHAAGHEGLVIAIEATGSLHRAWATELERLHPGSVRLFAPSETRSARTQLGSGRFKTDDRDCAALTYLARQGAGRAQAEESVVDELRAAVRHRRGLVADRKVAQQRLHDQLNALVPGLSAPAGHGRSLGRGTHRASRAGLRGRLRWSPAGHPLPDRQVAGPDEQGHGDLLGRPVARRTAPAAGCPGTDPPAGPGPGALPEPAG